MNDTEDLDKLPPLNHEEILAKEVEKAKIMDFEKNLTEFQRKLVNNIVYKCMDRATACKSAGSTAGTRSALQHLAHETLQKPHVQAYQNYLMEKKAEFAGVDKQEVLQGLRDVLSVASKDKDHKHSLRALELMGQAIGLFKTVSMSKTKDKSQEDGGKSSHLADSEDEDSNLDLDLTKLQGIVGSISPKRK